MTWQEPQDDPDWRSAYGDYGQQGSQAQPGQTPYGQYQDPSQYGQYGQYGQDPYGQYSYGGYGPAGVPQSGSNGSAIAALVCNIVAAVLCCGGLAWIPGVIVSAIAVSRASTDPESSRKLTIAGWICVAADVVLMVALFVVLGLIGAYSDSSST
jgi:hypothetical protein